MRQKLFFAIALFSSFIFLMAVIANLNGKWRGSITTPDGTELQAVYNFKVDGDKLSGTAETPSDIVTIDSGKVMGNTFSFQVTVDGTVYPHKGIIYDDSCGLDIDFESGQMIHTTIVRDTAR